eukprot:759362-Pyramimonas_sp.AAC.1
MRREDADERDHGSHTGLKRGHLAASNALQTRGGRPRKLPRTVVDARTSTSNTSVAALNYESSINAR